MKEKKEEGTSPNTPSTNQYLKSISQPEENQAFLPQLNRIQLRNSKIVKHF